MAAGRLTSTVPLGGATVVIDWSELGDVLAKLGEAAGDPGPELMRLAAEDIIDGIQEEFETEGHGRWEPLAESTLAKRRGSVAQILVDTGAMRGSINSEGIAAGDTWAEISAAPHYSGFHVTGTVNMPARNFFDVLEQYVDRAADTILGGILERADFPAEEGSPA